MSTKLFLGGILFFFSSFTGLGQILDLGGPTQLGWCERAEFAAVFTAGPQTESAIMFTVTRPNADFLYVANSAKITFPNESEIPAGPTSSNLDLIWDVNEILESAYELSPGETLTVTFALETRCGTPSGTLSARVDYKEDETARYLTDSQSIEILPGAVRIYKEPSVIQAHVGDIVTWTITVENTGLGPIHNMVVTDVLGPGLAYVSSNPPGTPSGQTVTWELGTLQAGEQQQIQLQVEVVACAGLQDKADVRFGCDDGSICYDTALQGGTATASIHLILDNPLLDFTPPAIQFPYCNQAGITVTMPVRNNGPGPAKNVRICVNFPSDLQVQNVQGGASWDGSCFHLPDIPAGGVFNLTFDLVYTGDWGVAIPFGSLFWQAIYENVCGDEFRPPAQFGTYGTDYGPQGPPTLTVSLTGDSEVYICTEHTYNLSVTFSGLTTCGGGTTSNIMVVVTVPEGFVVTDAGGGIWVPGPNGTGGTITWTIPPDSPLTTSIALRAPGAPRCGQVGTLTATATATSCCGCTLSSSSTIPIAIECYQLVAATRTASATVQEKCGSIVYTNTYQFADDPALDGISFDEVIFTEYATNNQDYVKGTLSITIDGASANPISLVDNTPGGTFEIQGIDDTGSVRGHTLVISYELAFTASSLPNTCPSTYSFYSWSTLDLGSDCSTGDECTEPCEFTEVLLLTTTTPSMSVSISGLPSDFADPCGTYNVTLTLTKTSDFDPHDVRLQLENLNYYIVDLFSITCSGICPPNLIPTDYGTYYEWDYKNAFVGQPNGAQSILQFQVRKRCTPARELEATALFTDSCGYSSCSVFDWDTPAFMRQPLLYLYKTPEVIYATQNEVTWTIYVTNGGAGPAYEVWVDDILGSGLVYESSVVDPDVAVLPNQDHTGASINGVSFHIPMISPGGTRVIQVTARMVRCQDLTDTVFAGQSCGNEECVAPISDSSYVLIPSTMVVATSYTQSPMNACSENWAQITIRNAGDPAVYQLVATQTLPPGLAYLSGTTQWRKGGGSWASGGDPTITGDPAVGCTLEWTQNEIPGMDELRSRTTLEIQFKIKAVCNFQGGDFQVEVQYQNVCSESGVPAVGTFRVQARRPDIYVEKLLFTPIIECGGLCEWEIWVTNTGDATADYVWVEDVLGDGFTYMESGCHLGYSVDHGVNSGQVVTWAVENLPPWETAMLWLLAQDNGTCGSLTNEVRVWWGCGDDIDRSSATNDSTCLWEVAATATTEGTRTPTVSLSATLDPSSIPACGQASLILTIQNTSTATARAIDARIILPTKLAYISGSTEIDCGSGFNPASDPQISGQTLLWYDENNASINLCDSIPPGGTIRLRFGVQASCYATSGSASIRVWYYDCCEEIQQYRDGSSTLSPALPRIAVTKTPASVARDCHNPDDTVTWTITVTNTGAAQADWVRLEDTLGGSLVYVSSNPPATPMDGPKWGWEFGPLGPGESRTFELTAYLSRPQETCSTALRTNTANVYWGCGTFDGNPNTADGCQLGGPLSASAVVTIPNLYIAPSDIDPRFTCSSDGNYPGSVRLTIRNTGDAPVTKDFQITLSEMNTGWTVSGYFSTDFGGTLPINANSSRTITIPGWPVTCSICTYNFTVQLDTNDDVCECIEGNNTNSQQWTITNTIPDITVRSSDITLSCAGDGQVRISGTITLGNEGCGNPLTANIPVQFTLYDQPNCTGEILDQWTQTLTGVNIPSQGAQTFTLSPRSINLNACGPGCTLYLRIEVDYTGSICECDGTNNSACVDLPVNIPDLVIVGEDLTLSCAGDDQVLIAGTVTLGNEGCGSTLIADVPIQFTLRNGNSCTGNVLYTWTEPFRGANIPPSGTQTFNVSHTFPIDLCREATSCTVSLLIEADYTSSICECDGTNNSLCKAFTVQIPDLAVIEVIPNVPNACTKGSVQVKVTNVGCTESPAGTAVRITGSATGETLLPALGPGEAAIVTVDLNEVLPCDPYTITATVDPDNSLCECNSTNNAKQTSFTVMDPDLVLQDLQVTCNGDGSFMVSVVVRNTGTENASENALRIYVNDDLFATVAIPALAIGEGYAVQYVTPRLKCGRAYSFRLVVDEDDALCECNEMNNEAQISASCSCPALVTNKEVVEIQRGGVFLPPSVPIQPGDVIHYRISAENVGGNTAFDVDLFDTLPLEFSYVPGSTSASWPSGSYSRDPDGAPGPNLSWNTSAELRPDKTISLEFKALVTSAVVQGELYTNTMRATGQEGEGSPIPPDMSGTIPADTDPDDSSFVSHAAAAVPALAVDKAILDVIRSGVSVWPTETVEPGDLIHYRFTIRNVGQGIAYDVDFADELPAGLEYDTDYADGSYVVDSPGVSGSLGVPDGTTGTFSANISAQIDGGGKLVADFYAYVTSDVRQGVDLVNYARATGVDGYGTPIEPENPEANDTSDDDPDDLDPDDTGLARIGVAEPALALEKEIVDVLRDGMSVWPTPFVLWGDIIVYQVTIRNVGLGTAYNVDFTDELPFGLAYDMTLGDGTYVVDNPYASGTLGIPDGATGLITADISVTLASAGTLEIVYRARVTPEAVPGFWLTNQAVVTGQDGAGIPILEFNPDTNDTYPDKDWTTIRVGAPALVTDKAWYCPPCDPCAPEPTECKPCPEEPIEVKVDEIVRFKLTVTNVGYSPAHNIVVEDQLPNGFEYVKESAVLSWPEGELKLEPAVSEGTVLTWITGLSLDAGESLSLVFSVRVTKEALTDNKEVVNVMRAEGVDSFNVPIPPDSSMYVPADNDPDDTDALRLRVLSATGALPSSGDRTSRIIGGALLGLVGLGGLLGVIRRPRFLGVAFLLVFAGIWLLAYPQEARYTVRLVSDPPRAGALFGAGTYKAGELVQVSALPNLGFEFVGWFEDEKEVSTSPFFEFPAERDRVLVARFRPVLVLAGLGWQSQGRFAFLPSPALEFLRFEIRPRFRFGLNPWDFRAVAAFAGNTWNDAQFHFTGAWDRLRFGGGLFFAPSDPAYRSAYTMLSIPWDDLTLGFRVVHYPRYGTPPGPALLTTLTLTMPGKSLTVRFEEKDVLSLEDVTFSLYELKLCCDLTLGGTLSWTKKEGFSYLRLSAMNIPLWCCGLSADLSVNFKADTKSVEFTPRWSYCEACLEVFGDVLWDPTQKSLEGLALYGYRIRCCFGPKCCPAGPGGSVEFLTAFEPSRVPGGFRGEEFEYLKAAFCGPSCCGGNYRIEVTAFFRPTGGLFGFSRLLVVGTVPLAPGLSLEPKLEIPAAGDVTFSLGWTWR